MIEVTAQCSLVSSQYATKLRTWSATNILPDYMCSQLKAYLFFLTGKGDFPKVKQITEPKTDPGFVLQSHLRKFSSLPAAVLSTVTAFSHNSTVQYYSVPFTFFTDCFPSTLAYLHCLSSLPLSTTLSLAIEVETDIVNIWGLVQTYGFWELLSQGDLFGSFMAAILCCFSNNCKQWESLETVNLQN